MSKGLKKLSLAIVVLGALLIGCGDSTRNNQGVSFTFLGWFFDSSGTSGRSGIVAPISATGFDAAVPDDEAGDPGGSASGFITAFAGLQNNMYGQFIRLQSVHFSYFVPGGSVTPPDNVFVTNGLIGSPADEEILGQIPIDSTIPPGVLARGNPLFVEVPVVNADIRTFVNLHRHLLPELPFTMIATASFTGVTSAGETVVSNEIDIEIIFTTDDVVPPTEGDGSGAEGDGQTTGDEAVPPADDQGGDGSGDEPVSDDGAGDDGDDAAL